MTLHTAVDVHKPKHRRRIFGGLLLATLTLLILSRHPPTDPSKYDFAASSPLSPPSPADTCDLFHGDWVPDPSGPYYTNETCRMIQEHQNCMKHGRPDTGYLRWRWRPEDCLLRKFEPTVFLEAMRGKKMAFIGDSLARNQMQSLMCLLSRVATPKDISSTSNHDYRRMWYEEYDFTLSVFWSPYLVRYEDPDERSKFWKLYLDEVDPAWISEIGEFRYLIISDGNWFARPSLFFEAGRLVGCNFCQLENITELSLVYSNRMAFRTALAAIVDVSDFEGELILRTLSPDHFENGAWNRGGNCPRTEPFKRGEREATWLEGELHRAQVEEFAAAAKKRGGRGRVEFRLLDVLEAMLRRPDGHPNAFGQPPHAGAEARKDCVHWCLPGPVDAWNELLLRMLVGDK